MSELKLPHRHGDERTDKVVDALPDIGAITTVADAMKHLGDPSRQRVFWLLCHAGSGSRPEGGGVAYGMCAGKGLIRKRDRMPDHRRPGRRRRTGF